jgi:transcriptional regulator with XRE-family HTH domain
MEMKAIAYCIAQAEFPPLAGEAIEIFKTRLAQTREGRGLSQAELSRLSGLAPSSVSQFEAGIRKPNFDSLRKLADVLQVSADYLIGRVDDENQSQTEVLFRSATELSADELRIAREFVDFLKSKRS